MVDLKLYYGQVIDNIDKDNKGKIQVKILPEMKDVPDNETIWCHPFVGGEKTVKLDVPEIGEKVWVLSEPDFVFGAFYIGESSLNGAVDLASIKSSINGVAPVGDISEVEFKSYSSGNIVFINKKTGAMGFIHNKGTTAIVDGDGNFIIEAGTALKQRVEVSESGIDLQGTITISGAGSSLEVVGVGIPSGSGAFLGVPTCLVTGAPIAGTKIMVTG